MDKILTTTEVSWIDENEIMIHKSLHNAVHRIQEARENIAAATQLLKGRCLPTLKDLNRCKKVSSEARQLYASEINTRNLRILAVVAGNPVARVVGTFFTRLDSAPYKVRLFVKHEEAYQWLLENR